MKGLPTVPTAPYPILSEKEMRALRKVLPEDFFVGYKGGSATRAPAIYVALRRWLEDNGALGRVSDFEIINAAGLQDVADRYLLDLKQGGRYNKNARSDRVTNTPALSALMETHKALRAAMYPLQIAVQEALAVRFGVPDESEEEADFFS
jgi:hypothetical protein